MASRGTRVWWKWRSRWILEKRSGARSVALSGRASGAGRVERRWLGRRQAAVAALWQAAAHENGAGRVGEGSGSSDKVTCRIWARPAQPMVRSNPPWLCSMQGLDGCLFGRYNGVGIIIVFTMTLCHDDDIRVVFGNLSVVFRLLDIIIWGYMLRKRGRPLMVTAQYSNIVKKYQHEWSGAEGSRARGVGNDVWLAGIGGRRLGMTSAAAGPTCRREEEGRLVGGGKVDFKGEGAGGGWSGSIVFLLVEVVAILFTGATSKDTTNPFTSLDCPSPPPSASPSPPSSAINSTFQSNVLALLDDLPSAAGPTGFASLSRGEGADRAFVRGMCRGDSTPDDCATYLRSAVLDINGHCNSNRRAAIWYDKCFLSYADTNASTAYENSYHAELYNVNNVTDKVGFERTYYALMSRLRARAANDTARMFAAGEAVYDPGADNGTMYGLVQCMRDRTAAECDRCLNDSVQQLPSCCWGHQGGVVLGYNYYVRVEIYTYYDLTVDAQPPSPGPSASSSKPSIGEGQGEPASILQLTALVH
uniref:OSJNBa0061C06.2 protein n=1 Tax=Oryza sativa subsp. japonica TaxID=39947 RepID=Q5JQV3_ORYSJ|nr:OSJNBa0061C06.2 [Oryza sativa Japonica Group]